jgi:hypothetical protein
MHGLLLIAGVMSACFSLVLFAGGLVMLFLSCFVARGDDNRFNDGERTFSFFIASGCFYLGLSALLGLWVPAESWIIVGCLGLVSAFLVTVVLAFEKNAVDQADSMEEPPKDEAQTV